MAYPHPQPGQSVKFREGAGNNEIRKLVHQLSGIGKVGCIGEFGIGLVENDNNTTVHFFQKRLDILMVSVGSGGIVGIAEKHHSGVVIDPGKQSVQVVQAVGQTDSSDFGSEQRRTA